MKTSKKYLAIDLGASSGRGIIGEFDGDKITLTENHRFENNPSMVGDKFLWDIDYLYENIRQSVNSAVAEGQALTSMGIDTWGVDYGILDKEGNLTARPYHYRDARTSDILDYVNKVIPIDSIYETTGIQTMNFNTIFQLAADIRQNPNAFENGKKILFIPDLLNYFLTGKMATEYTIASTGAILDPKTRKYAKDMLNKLGIPSDIFCGDPVMPGNVLGSLKNGVLSNGLSSSLSVVNVASHDTASAVLAVPAKKKDFVYISSGTWSLLGTELDSPLINDLTKKYNYTNEGGADGSIRFLKNIMGLWIIQECRRYWRAEGTTYSFSELTDMAAASKPFACIINPDDPMFAPPGNMPSRIVDYCKRTGQYVPETIGEIIRCVLDSLALCYRNTVRNLSELTGKSISAINIVGGGTQNKLLCKLTADISGLPVIAGPVEATAAGNILSQMITAGDVKDIWEAREVIARSFDTTYYEPKTSSDTEIAYEKFLDLLK